MAKPRTTTNILALKGSFKHNPERGRARSQEPVPMGEIGSPPPHLSPDVRAAWEHLVSMAHAGTLCASDSPFMEYAAKVWAEVRAAEKVPPPLGIRIESVFARLGMSPADRSRVSVIKPGAKESDPHREFG